MKIGTWTRLLLAAAPLLAGCGDFWQAPGGGSSASFTLTNSGAISVSPGASNTSTITVTPTASFTGTVTLNCTVTTSPSGASNLPSCSPSPASLTFSSATAQTSTLTATTASNTTTGVYQLTVTGVSGSVAETTTVCLAVGSSSGSCTTASNSGNFYILNSPSSGSPTIAGYSIVSSALTALPSSPYAVPSAPYAMAIAPNGNFLYVSTATGVYLYTIGTGGALGTATQITQDLAYSLQVDTTNSWLVEAIPFNGGSGGVTLNAVPINSTTGAFVSGGTVATVSFTVASATLEQNQMVISPDNANLFVALGTGGTLVVPFDSTGPFPSGIKGTGIKVANSGGAALSVAIDPSSTPRLFYIGETLAKSSSGGLRAFTYASLSAASVSELTGSPYATGGLAPVFILPIASGDDVYVADRAGTIAGFAVTSSGTTYSLTAGSTATAGTTVAGLAQDNTGAFLLAVSSGGSPYFDAYTFDSTTAGKLDSQITGNTGASPIAIVAAP